MVPKVTKRGTSFKGALAYYLHDKREPGEASRDTSERVAWTATRGFAKDNMDPELAGRIMAATAMDQDRLKQEAGVKKTGQKSKGCVYAYSVAWHPDEAGKIDQAEMLKAAEQSLEAIGAGDRQAVIVAHNDEPHPHVHVIVNLVSQEDGRNLSVHADRNKLSAWALDYRRARGEETKYTPKRAEKAEAIERKKNGEKVDYVAGEKSRPRGQENDYQEARGANDNSATAAQDQQAGLNAELKSKERAMNKRHAQEWADHPARLKEKIADIKAQAKTAIERTVEQIKAQRKPEFQTTISRHTAERQGFEEREATLAGKISNVMGAIKSRKVSGIEEDDKNWMAAGFNFMTSKDARAAALDKLHRVELRKLTQAEREEIGSAKASINADTKALLSSTKKSFMTDRAGLIERQASEREQIKKAWQQRRVESSRAFHTVRATAEAKQTRKARPGPRTDKAQGPHKSATEGRHRRRGPRRVRKRDRSED